jgi:hypothetical protein
VSREEGFAAVGVEAAWQLAAEDGNGLVVIERGVVGAWLDDGVVSDSDGEDAGFKGQLRCGELVWVAGAIEALVVCAGDEGETAEGAKLSEDLAGDAGMLAHEAGIRIGEQTGLVEDEVGEAEIAKVVEEGGALNERAPFFAEAEATGDAQGGFGDAERVTGSVGRLGVNDAGEDLADVIESCGREGAWLWRLKKEDSLECLLDGRSGEGCGPKLADAVEVIDDANEHGIEPGAALTPEEFDGVFSLVAGCEEIEVVGHGEDTAGERGLIADAVRGQAASIPVLVKARNGFHGEVIETEAVQQGSATLAAKRDESGGVVLPGEAEAKNSGEAAQRLVTGLDGLPQKAQGCGLGMAGVSTVEPEERGMEEPVVAAAGELVEAGREAAAPDVLE